MLGVTLKQLHYFIVAAETGSLVETANALGVAQPTVSHGIHAMEDALDVELFTRQHAKGVSLTSAGRGLLPEARFLVDRSRDYQTRAQAYSSVLAGTLKIGCYSPLAAVFLPSIIAECSARFPKISLSFVEGPVEELIQKLESGELDLALKYETGLPNGLISTPVKEGHPYIILPDGHPMLRHLSIDLRDMVEEPFVLIDTPPGREYFLGLFKDAGLNPNIAFRSPSFEVVRGLVGRGVGYSILITRPRSNWTYDG